MTYDRPINIMIVDDHEMLRRGLRDLLESVPRFRVVAEAAGMEDALVAVQHFDEAQHLDEAQDNVLDLVVADLVMPHGFPYGIELTRRLHADFPALFVLIYTGAPQEEFVLQAREAGAHGYVLKDQPPTDLIDAINKIVNGQEVFPLDFIEHFVKLLTPTERKVLWLLGDGKSNKYIGEELSISMPTVNKHRTNICEKLKSILPEEDCSITMLIHIATRYRMRCHYPS